MRENNSFENRVRRIFELKAHRASDQYVNHLLRILNRIVLPEIGHLTLAGISVDLLRAVLLLVERNHGVEVAHRICSVCSEVFRDGIVGGECEWNPAVEAREALSLRMRSRIPRALDLDEFNSLIVRTARYDGPPHIGAALRLSVYLLARPAQLCSMTWRDIDWRNAAWRYTFASSGRRTILKYHEVPLSRQALRILKNVQSASGGTTHVFANPKMPSVPIEPRALRRALRSVGSREVSTNALRATVKIVLRNSLGIPVHVIDQQLYHAAKHRSSCEFNCESCMRGRRDMMQLWANWVDDMLDSDATASFKT